jgi:predicted amidohydrolase YtcJ
VLLDADPVDTADTSLEQADRLRDTRVHATWVAGELVYAEA